MTIPSPDLLSVTIDLLYQHVGRWPALSKTTGLSYSWINQVARGVIKNPGYRSLQALHDALVALAAPDRVAA